MGIGDNGCSFVVGLHSIHEKRFVPVQVHKFRSLPWQVLETGIGIIIGESEREKWKKKEITKRDRRPSMTSSRNRNRNRNRRKWEREIEKKKERVGERVKVLETGIIIGESEREKWKKKKERVSERVKEIEEREIIKRDRRK